LRPSCSWRVGTDTDYGVARLRKLVTTVAKIARLGGAAGGHCPRIEEHHILLTLQVLVRYRLTVLILEIEGDRFSHGCSGGYSVSVLPVSASRAFLAASDERKVEPPASRPRPEGNQ